MQTDVFMSKLGNEKLGKNNNTPYRWIETFYNWHREKSFSTEKKDRFYLEK